MPMQVSKYHSTTKQTNSPRRCEDCNPAIFQVFFSAYANDCVGDYEPDYLDFIFFENGYGKFIADLREDVEKEKAYNEWIAEINTATIDVEDLRELERSLVGLVPSKPERTVQTTYIYDDCAKGNECFHQQDYENAIQHYRTAAEHQWNDYVTFCLSLSYYLKGDYPNAAAIANRYNGSVYELPTFSRGMNCFVLDTTPIDKLNYLLERRMVS